MEMSSRSRRRHRACAEPERPRRSERCGPPGGGDGHRQPWGPRCSVGEGLECMGSS